MIPEVPRAFKIYQHQVLLHRHHYYPPDDCGQLSCIASILIAFSATDKAAAMLYLLKLHLAIAILATQDSATQW
jgi:hypothetical protein